jgi:hypothetical protein
MKQCKYKLIKKYPGSDPVGTIVTGYGKDGWYSKGPGGKTYDWTLVVYNPEYWEEVVEKDYEILSFKQDSGITDLWTKFSGGWSRNVNGYPATAPYTLEDILKNNLYTIHSVKRLSDGEVFTVGDRINIGEEHQICIRTISMINISSDGTLVIDHEHGGLTNSKHNGIFHRIKQAPLDYEIMSYIKKGSTTCTTTKRRGGENHEEFWNIYSVKRLSDGEVFTIGDTVKMYEHSPIKTIETITTNSIRSSIKQGVWFTYNSGSSHMDHAVKQKQPIYLTHDGKDIFEGDKVWWVNKEAFYYDYFPAFSGLKFSSDINAYFLTEEEAKNYIIENKPALSIKEFWEITGMSTSNFNKNTYMKNLVKERLNLK